MKKDNKFRVYIVNDSYPSCGTALASGLYGGVLAVRHALGK